MGTIINVDFRGGLSVGSLVMPPKEEQNCITDELAEERTVDPIKDPVDIQRMIDYFRSNQEWRNLMYFIVAISTGLRVSDMLSLRWGSLLCEDDNGSISWRSEIVILEKKTKNTRKRKRNRHIAINQAIRDVATEYLGYMDARGIEITLDMPLFCSEARNRSTGASKPMHRNSVDKFLKKAARATGVADRVRIGNHSTRKTFGYQMMRQNGNSGRTLLLLQKMFGHSTSAVTLAYIGLTDDEIRDAYLGLEIPGASSDNPQYTQTSICG